MAGSVNKVILVGHLGRDPEARTFQNGGKIVNLRLATSESWRDKQSGERKERTEWHSVAIMDEGLCKIAEQYLRKGSLVYIEGKLETRKWQDQSGQDRYTTEVVLRPFGSTLTMLGSKSDGGDRQQSRDHGDPARQAPAGYGGSAYGASTGGAAADMDDDIPFACDRRL